MNGEDFPLLPGCRVRTYAHGICKVTSVRMRSAEAKGIQDARLVNAVGEEFLVSARLALRYLRDKRVQLP